MHSLWFTVWTFGTLDSPLTTTGVIARGCWGRGGGGLSGTASKHTEPRIDTYLRCIQAGLDAYHNASFLQSNEENPRAHAQKHRCAWRASTNAFLRCPLLRYPLFDWSETSYDENNALRPRSNRRCFPNGAFQIPSLALRRWLFPLEEEKHPWNKHTHTHTLFSSFSVTLSLWILTTLSKYSTVWKTPSVTHWSEVLAYFCRDFATPSILGQGFFEGISPKTSHRFEQTVYRLNQAVIELILWSYTTPPVQKYKARPKPKIHPEMHPESPSKPQIQKKRQKTKMGDFRIFFVFFCFGVLGGGGGILGCVSSCVLGIGGVLYFA